jgi:hypothetical protein
VGCGSLCKFLFVHVFHRRIKNLPFLAKGQSLPEVTVAIVCCTARAECLDNEQLPPRNRLHNWLLGVSTIDHPKVGTKHTPVSA